MMLAKAIAECHPHIDCAPAPKNRRADFCAPRRSSVSAFTLAELLIALLILGEIATFTIPKVLSSQQNGRYNAIAKEAAGMVSGAFLAYQQGNTVTGATKFSDLTPYMNFVKADTTTPADDWQNAGQWGCDSGIPCLRLHSGALLAYQASMTFTTIANTSAIDFQIDPDGTYGSTTNGPGKAINFALYANGRLTDKGNLLPNTYMAGVVIPSDSTTLPPWFHWN